MYAKSFKFLQLEEGQSKIKMLEQQQMKGKAYIHSLLHQLISNANLRIKQCTFLKPPDTVIGSLIYLKLNSL